LKNFIENELKKTTKYCRIKPKKKKELKKEKKIPRKLG
jgi:hypothetical protein